MFDGKFLKSFLVLAAILLLILVWPTKKEKRPFGLILEYARTPSEMARGLSGRADLADNQGLLFVYAEDTVPSFWMKEMNFSLDLIWLDRNWQIIGLTKNLTPATYPQTFSPPAPIRYVLEVKAGFVDKQRLKVGDRAYN